MEREVSRLVQDWQVAVTEYEGRTYRFYENRPVVVVCGGIGAENARRAAEAVISLYQPRLVISAGFAGALDRSFQAGQLLTPRHVIDAKDGSRTDAGSGDGVLVTFDSVADVEQKARLADAFGGHAVDMEAAAVARSATAHSVKFLALKTISDPHDSRLPPVMRFVGSDGRFQLWRFMVHIAVRPWLWSDVAKLARNSSVAARVLCEALSSSGWVSNSAQGRALVGSRT